MPVEPTTYSHTLVRDAVSGGTPALTARLTPADGVAGTKRTACEAPVGTAIQVEKKTAGHWWPVIGAQTNDFRQHVRCAEVPSLPSGDLDAIVFLGQSNCSGRGEADPGIDPYPQNGERLFYLGPEMDIISPPTEPIDADGALPVYAALSEGSTVGYGPAVSTLHYLSALPGWTTRQIVACVCAKGGTTSTEWLRSTTVSGYYAASIARALWIQRYATIRAAVIYQGETDGAATPVTWATNWRATIANIRSDLGLPLLPIIIVQLPAVAATGFDHWADVRTQQADVATDEGVSMVAAGAGTLDGLVHLDTPAQLALGSDLADAIAAAVTL